MVLDRPVGTSRLRSALDGAEDHVPDPGCGGLKGREQVPTDPEQLGRPEQEHPLGPGEGGRPGGRVGEVEPDHLEMVVAA